MGSRRVLGVAEIGLAVFLGCGGSGGDDTESGDGALSAPAGASSPIPEGQLTVGATLTVVADVLNCRATPGTSSAVVTQFKKGDTLVVKPPEDQLTTARTPDGQLWVLVAKDDGPKSCYVAADTRFVTLASQSAPAKGGKSELPAPFFGLWCNDPAHMKPGEFRPVANGAGACPGVGDLHLALDSFVDPQGMSCTILQLAADRNSNFLVKFDCGKSGIKNYFLALELSLSETDRDGMSNVVSTVSALPPQFVSDWCSDPNRLDDPSTFLLGACPEVVAGSNPQHALTVRADGFGPDPSCSGVDADFDDGSDYFVRCADTGKHYFISVTLSMNETDRQL